MQYLINNLSDAINNDLHISVTSKEIIITEEDIKATCKQVVLKFASKNIFAFSLDYKLKDKIKMFPFFDQSTANITKVNDCIVFYIVQNTIHIFLIELKSNHLGDYKIQLQAGKNFILYLKNMINLVFSKSYHIDEKNIKCLVFTTKSMPSKQGTKRTNIKYEEVNGLKISRHPCGSNFNLDMFI